MHSDNENKITLDRRFFCVSAIGLVTLGTTACGGGGGGGGGSFFGGSTAAGTAATDAAPLAAVDPSSEPAAVPAAAPAPQKREFVHPGLLHTELATGRWVHVAVTLSDTIGTLYVDGVVAGTNAQMTLAPFHLGETTQNWLGRSQFSNDPDLQGRVDDFRLYGGALGATEIAALALG